MSVNVNVDVDTHVHGVWVWGHAFPSVMFWDMIDTGWKVLALQAFRFVWEQSGCWISHIG